MNGLIVAGFIGLTCAVAMSAQAPPRARSKPRPTAQVATSAALPAVTARPASTDATTSTAAPALNAATERDLLNRYCVSCHSERAKAAGMDSARKLALDGVD